MDLQSPIFHVEIDRTHSLLSYSLLRNSTFQCQGEPLQTGAALGRHEMAKTMTLMSAIFSSLERPFGGRTETKLTPVLTDKCRLFA